MQKKHGKHNLGFATCTLPAVNQDAYGLILKELSDITRRFYQKISRIYSKRGVKFCYVGCVEIQERRFKQTGMAVPHLHFVYVSRYPRSKQYVMSTKDAYDSWNKAVNEVLVLHGCKPIMGVGNHEGSVKLESVRKSASAYLGKYISKGCKVVADMIDAGIVQFPKQWWTACMDAKRMLKDAIIKPSQDICQMLFYDSDTLYDAGLVAWMQSVWIDYGGQSYRAGMVGLLSEEFYNYIVRTNVQ